MASGPVAAQAAPAHAPIQGSGSSWAYNAVNQWIADTSTQGLQVVFTSTGSAQGRQDFARRLNDFAVSDVGFQGTDTATGQPDTSQGRQFGYLPLAAGGTSFPYQIRVGGQLVRGLRLSGLTLAKIFTNQITSWSDPAVTADNNGQALPPIPSSRSSTPKAPGRPPSSPPTSTSSTRIPGGRSPARRDRPSTSPKRLPQSRRTAPTV